MRCCKLVTQESSLDPNHQVNVNSNGNGNYSGVSNPSQSTSNTVLSSDVKTVPPTLPPTLSTAEASGPATAAIMPVKSRKRKANKDFLTTSTNSYPQHTINSTNDNDPDSYIALQSLQYSSIPSPPLPTPTSTPAMNCCDESLLNSNQVILPILPPILPPLLSSSSSSSGGGVLVPETGEIIPITTTNTNINPPTEQANASTTIINTEAEEGEEYVCIILRQEDIDVVVCSK